MMNAFERDYQQELKIRADYDAAEKAGDEIAQEAARTAIHKLWEGINEKGGAYARIYRDYKTSRDKGNDLIDLRDVIWDKDVERLIACMRENGIARFTFSSTWSSAVETAWLFKENGCELEGLIQVNGDKSFFKDDEYDKAPAYLFSIR